MKRLITSSVLAASLMIVGVGEVRAFDIYDFDTKTYAGSICVPWNAQPPRPSLTASAIRNPDATLDLPLDCPVVKDGSRITSASVRVHDLHPSENVGCTLNTLHWTDAGVTVGYTSPMKWSAGYGLAAQKLSFGTTDMINGPVHYYFSCTIPDRELYDSSQIDSFTVTEGR